MPAKELAGIGS